MDKVCSFCLNSLGKTSYRRVTRSSHSNVLHIIFELGYNLDKALYICKKCNGILEKRVKIENDYENRFNFVSIIKNKYETTVKQDQEEPPQTPPRFTSPSKLHSSTPTSARKLSSPPISHSKHAKPRTTVGTPKSARKLQFGGVKRSVYSPYKSGKKFRPIVTVQSSPKRNCRLVQYYCIQ